MQGRGKLRFPSIIDLLDELLRPEEFEEFRNNEDVHILSAEGHMWLWHYTRRISRLVACREWPGHYHDVDSLGFWPDLEYISANSNLHLYHLALLLKTKGGEDRMLRRACHSVMTIPPMFTHPYCFAQAREYFNHASKLYGHVIVSLG